MQGITIGISNMNKPTSSLMITFHLKNHKNEYPVKAI